MYIYISFKNTKRHIRHFAITGKLWLSVFGVFQGLEKLQKWKQSCSHDEEKN